MIKKKLTYWSKVVFAFLTLLSYRCDVKRESSYKISFVLVARWYSPVFWLIVGMMFIGTFFLGGFLHLKKMVTILRTQFDSERFPTSFGLPYDVSRFERFFLIYNS